MEDRKPESIMFYCGAQLTADGDLLPESFTVFPNSTAIEDAAVEVLEKITDQIAELKLKAADGQMSFQSISTWQEFAELKIDDHVKLKALVDSTMQTLAEFTAYTCTRLVPIMQESWLAPVKSQ